MPRVQIALLFYLVAGALWAVAPREGHPMIPPTASIVIAVAATWAGFRFSQDFDRKPKDQARGGRRS